MAGVTFATPAIPEYYFPVRLRFCRKAASFLLQRTPVAAGAAHRGRHILFFLPHRLFFTKSVAETEKVRYNNYIVCWQFVSIGALHGI